MGRSRNRCIAGVVAAIAVSSCSSSGESDQPTTPPPVHTVQPNAGNVTQATFGFATAVGDLTVTATAPVLGSDDGGPWLTMTVRAENRSPNEIQSPQFELHCKGNPAGGASIPSATFDVNKPVPSLSTNEGTLTLLVPGDDRLGGSRPVCATPATLVATTLSFDNQGASPPKRVRVEWPVPDDLVDRLNAAPQPA